MKSKIIDNLIFVGVFVGVWCVFSLILAFPTMLLWNWLMPEIFGLTRITLLQAVGLKMLCSILFKPKGNESQEMEDESYERYS